MRVAGRPGLGRMRARSRALLAAILPALVLRALIPVGFMPVAASAGPEIQLCPGIVSAAGVHSGHHHHHEAGSAEGSAHSLCVFAASAAPAVAPVAATMPLRAVDGDCLALAHSSCLRLPSILRTQSARAPPVLS